MKTRFLIIASIAGLGLVVPSTYAERNVHVYGDQYVYHSDHHGRGAYDNRWYKNNRAHHGKRFLNQRYRQPHGHRHVHHHYYHVQPNYYGPSRRDRYYDRPRYPVPIQRNYTGYQSYTPIVTGGIIGGIIGNQFGRGSGKRILTAAGALLGGSIGRDLQHDLHYDW